MTEKIHHPMILALGLEAFKKDLDAQPVYCNDALKGNYKPIGMQIIWEMRSVNYTQEGQSMAKRTAFVNLVDEVYHKWEDGASRQDAVNSVIDKLKKIVN